MFEHKKAHRNVVSESIHKFDVGVFKPTLQMDFLDLGIKAEECWSQGGFTEGPTIDNDGSVFFSDIPRHRIMRFDPKNHQTTIWREDCGAPNGLKFTPEGNLLVCEGAEGGNRRLSCIDRNENQSIVADQYEGRKLNSPNDVIVAPNGDIYFSDPRYIAFETGEEKELDFEGVFRVRAGQLMLATKELLRPNGLLITRDGKHAFLADNHHWEGGNRDLVRMEVTESGALINKKVLFSFRQNQRSFDGMTFDMEGNIYACAGVGEDAGIYVFSQNGEHLALISNMECPTNCTFGGPSDPSTLYYTAQLANPKNEEPSFGLFSISMKKNGYTIYP